MSTPRRFLLPVLALAASVVTVTASAVVVTVGFDETASAASLSHPRPFHRPSRPKPKPTLGQRAARRALREVGVPAGAGSRRTVSTAPGSSAGATCTSESSFRTARMRSTDSVVVFRGRTRGPETSSSSKASATWSPCRAGPNGSRPVHRQQPRGRVARELVRSLRRRASRLPDDTQLASRS